MAASFEIDTPVLWYGPRAHVKAGPRKDRVYLLWPAWAFRVVAPEIAPQGLNVLQKAILGVLSASRLTAEELGQRLGIHAELAAFVVGELQSQERVDIDWQVTKRGRDALEDARDASARLVPGWVFRDPWTERLWPFIAPSLERARISRNDRGYPLLELGTTGLPWQQRPWLVQPPQQHGPSLPEAGEILHAVRRQRRQARRSKVLGRWADEEDDIALPNGLDLMRITCIEEQAHSVFLATFLYVPHEGNDTDWYACDFFGRGTNPELRRLIARVARDDERLARAMEPLFGLSGHENAEKFQELIAAWESKAENLLEHALSLDIRRYQVTVPLAEMLAGWLEVEALGRCDSPRHLRGVLTACRRALEQLFGDLARDWPLARVTEDLAKGDECLKQAQLRGAARELGFVEIPAVFLRAKLGDLRAVSEYGHMWKLRPLVVATLLRARADEAHPLRGAARRAPALLDWIHEIAELGGEAAHENKTRTLTRSLALQGVLRTLEIVGCVLGLPVRSLDGVLNHG